VRVLTQEVKKKQIRGQRGGKPDRQKRKLGRKRRQRKNERSKEGCMDIDLHLCYI